MNLIVAIQRKKTEEPYMYDTLRISDKQWASLLREVENNARLERTEEQECKRPAPRHPRLMRCIVRVNHPGGTPATYLVRTRNISEGGLGFLHGGYLHTNTPCVILMQTNDKQSLVIEGKVAWCRLVQGRCHEIGVQFNKPITVEPFLNSHSPNESTPPQSRSA